MFAEEHDEGDFAGSDVFADGSGGGDSDGNEDVGVEATSEEGFKGALVDGEGGEAGSDDDERFEVKGPAGGEECAGGDGVGELAVEGGMLCGFAGGGSVAGLLDGGEELGGGGWWVGECEEGALSEEVDVGSDDTGNFGEGVLDMPGAVGAGHALDGERDSFHRSKLHGVAGDVE